MKRSFICFAVVAMFGALVTSAQEPQFPGRGGPPGFGGPGGRGPGGPMGGQERQILKQFDTDGNGWLNNDERQEARATLEREPSSGSGRGGPRGRGPGGPGGRADREPAKPGLQVSPADVTSYPDAGLYEPAVLRTLFLDFENEDWEAELQDFHNTDVEVPATLTTDGKKFANVGVSFRGMSSYSSVPAGYKRSLNLSLDLADDDQRLYGYKNLNLLNCNGDPSLMSAVLYSHIARQYIPAPKANFVKVVINGESWGVYANAQQFDKTFLAENYESTKGTRWKVTGSPRGDGGLRYLGDDIDEYKSRFEMKSNDGNKAWRALIELCRTLNETPIEDLETALEPILDIDGVLRFLALDVALINSDGYWTRASDYSLFRDGDGKFHVVPHDMNEAFRAARGAGRGPGGPRRPGGFGPGGPGTPAELATDPRRARDDRGAERDSRPAPEQQRPETDGNLADRGFRDRGPGGFGPGGPDQGAGGFELDPLVALNDAGKPLRSRLLAVPKLRAKYLDYVRAIAESSLDWKNLGPIVAENRELIEREVEADTRKLDSFEAFQRTTAPEAASSEGQGRETALRTFADQRRKFLTDYREPTENDAPRRE